MERSLNERLAPALDEYIEALEAGRRPDRDAHLKKHADLAAELEPCLDAIDLMFERGEAVEAGTTPKRVGDFELVRQVGRGGMGVVYEAEQISLHRRVALKMLPFAGILDPRHLQRFKNEAQAAAQLHHTNIVPVYSVGQDRGVHYYAMQFVDGISLAELIAELRATSGRDEPPSPSSAAAIEAVTKGSGARSTEYCRAVARLGVQAAQALDHAHELGIVHRDIKPANLLLDTIGHLWITDFGLASFATAPGPTITGDVVGTVRYMSPEQALAKRVPIDHRTDIYSLGASLYEAVTLEFTFPGDDARRVMHDIAFKEPVAPRRLNPAVPEELETILLKSMAKSPEHRYETAQAMADDLARFLEDRPILARRPSILRRTAQWSRRHRTLVGAVVALLLLTVIGLAVGFVLVNRERERAILSQAEAEAERARAEATLDTALRGIDEILVRQAERWEHSPGQPLARIDREFLLQAERLLDELLERNRGHAAVRLSQARMLVTAAKVRRALDRREDAMRDVEAAARMLEEVAASEAGALEALRLLVASHVGMGQLCYEVGEYDRAEIQLERAREVGEDLIATRPSDTWILDCLADGLLTLGKVSIARGDFPSAVELKEQAVTYCEAAWRLDAESCGAITGLAQAHKELGWTLQYLGRLEEAEDHLRDAIRYLQSWPTGETRPIELSVQLADCHRMLGRVLRGDRLPEAIEELERAVHVTRELLSSHGSLPAHVVLLGDTLGLLGDAYHRAGCSREAKRHLAEAFDLIKSFEPGPKVLTRRLLTLVNVRRQYAYLLASLGQLEESERLLLEVVDLAQRFPDEKTTHNQLSDTYPTLAYVRLQVGDREGSLAYLKKGLEHTDRIRRLNPGWVGYDLRSAELHRRIASQLMETDPGRAQQEREEAIRILTNVVRDRPTHRLALGELALAHTECARALLADGDDKSALVHANLAVDLARDYYETDPLPNSSAYIFMRILAARACHLEDPEARRRDCTEALAIADDLRARFADSHVDDGFVGLALYWLICDEQSETPVEELLGRLARAIEIFEREMRTNDMHAPNLVYLRLKRGELLHDLGRGAEAVADYERALELSPEKVDSPAVWFMAAGAHARLGHPQAIARNLYDKAVAWMEKHRPDDEELKRFRAEAEEVLGIGAG